MKTAARIALAIVVFLGGTAFLPASLSSGSVAFGGLPTPEITDLLPTLEPSPSPSEEPGDDGESGKKDGSKGGSGGSKDDRAAIDKSGQGAKQAADKIGDAVKRDRKRKGRNKDKLPEFIGTYRPTGPQGSFNTDELVTVAAHLRALGWSQEDVVAQVYPPFIVAGPAAWTNTWGAPRFGPGDLVRTHEGQDVFCSFGDPVLAPEDGAVSFDEGGLGGVVARVHRADGSYWYLAHLADINTELSAGQFVERGTVVGYCGNTGNALTTPPHVHFGWYQGNGKARNPMKALIEWLHDAERRARSLVAETASDRVEQISRLTAARRFGDGLVSPVSELDVPSEALWALRDQPAADATALGLADTALQVALSAQLLLDDSAAVLRVATAAPTNVAARQALVGHDGHDHSANEASD